MSKNKLVVNVSAKFAWSEQPKNMAEEAMRKQADNMANEAAHKLDQAVQLLILELLNSQVPNVEL